MAWRSLVLLLVLVVVLPVSLAADSISKVFNYPNPYDPATGDTTIVFFYNRTGAPLTISCTVQILNLVGHRVLEKQQTAALVTGMNTNTITWNGRTDRGDTVPPGVYYVRIVTGGGAGSVQSLSAYGKLMVK